VSTKDDNPSEPSQLRNIYKSKHIGNALMVFGISIFILFLISAWFVYTYRGEEYRAYVVCIGTAWVIGPPVYFFIEHFFLFKRFGDHTQYDQFKRA
jgi:hypothetical protein